MSDKWLKVDFYMGGNLYIPPNKQSAFMEFMRHCRFIEEAYHPGADNYTKLAVEPHRAPSLEWVDEPGIVMSREAFTKLREEIAEQEKEEDES